MNDYTIQPQLLKKILINPKLFLLVRTVLLMSVVCWCLECAPWLLVCSGQWTTPPTTISSEARINNARYLHLGDRAKMSGA